MKKVRILLVWTLTLMALTIPALAGNAHGDDSHATVSGRYYLVLNDDYYGMTIELWEEVNADPGLQRYAHCHPSGNPTPCAVGETYIPADVRRYMIG